jgi:hypothetical protein
MMISACKIRHWETTPCFGEVTLSILCEKWLLGGGYGPAMGDLVGEEVVVVGMSWREESHEYREEKELREKTVNEERGRPLQ